MLLALLLLQSIAAAPPTRSDPPPPPGEPADRATIVVTGKRLETTAADLARCLAEHCPPKRDIDLSLAHASAQLVAGDYHGSRRTLLAARHRNAGYAASLPVEVSDLHRANSKLSGLNGLVDVERIGVFDVVDALKAGLDRDDARVLVARLDVGDTFARQARITTAIEHYHRVAKDAQTAGIPLIVGMARFREATLLATIASVDVGWGPRARKAAAVVLDSPDPAWVPFRNGLRIVPAILAPAARQEGLIDDAMRQLEPYDYGSPKILFAPPVDLRDTSFGAAEGGEPEWVDLRFRVGADGRVADLAEVGRSPHFPSSWMKPIDRSLRLRRYSALQPGAPAPIRTERYAFVSDLVGKVGTGMRIRTSQRRVDILDLTPASQR